MLDSFNRNINYLRVSVTDRCNLRCTYCMPAEGIQMLRHGDILNFDEIVEVITEGVRLGITKVRLTGGEPLVRRDVVILVSMVAKISGIQDLSMTTNGILLEQFAKPLADAGLMRVNVSLDTMDAERFSLITRGGDISKVFSGIEAAKEAGLFPVKLNCVVQSSSQEKDARAVAEFAARNGFEVRFIHQMDLETGDFTIVEGGEGGDCVRCNRLRLTANGKIVPCLFSDDEYDVRLLGAAKAFQMAVANKPACGSVNQKSEFYNIGG
jgi:GTP 3',8-cyclase